MKRDRRFQAHPFQPEEPEEQEGPAMLAIYGIIFGLLGLAIYVWLATATCSAPNC